MSGTQGENAANTLVLSGRYTLYLNEPRPPLGGCAAYRARDSMTPGAEMLALAPSAALPARSNLLSFLGLTSDSVIPVARIEDPTYPLWLISPVPPGADLTTPQQTWSESALVEQVVRPIASLLSTLAASGLTHRAIRADNVFLTRKDGPVTVGPGCLAPPAFHQPATSESLWSAACAPICRGAGTIADDVFALGALVLTLWLGRPPMDGMAADIALQKRFGAGTFRAYTEGHAVPSGLRSLLQAMLSDTPESRPHPRDLETATVRKLFLRAPEPEAQTPIFLGETEVRSTRALAWAATKHAAAFTSLVRRDVAALWLRREAANPEAASRLTALSDKALPEDTSSARLNRTAFARLLMAIDPHVPIFWNGTWFWPDALASMMAWSRTQTKPSGLADIVADFPLVREFCHPTQLPDGSAARRRAPAGLLSGRISHAGTAGEIARFVYRDNPFQSCLSKRCAHARLGSMRGLIAWLSTEIPGAADETVLDDDMTAFIETNAERRGLVLGSHTPLAGAGLALRDLLTLATIQSLLKSGPLPSIARRLLPHLTQDANIWNSATTRKRRRDLLVQASEDGDLSKMQTLLVDPDARQKDSDARDQAAHLYAQLGRELDGVSEQYVRPGSMGARNATDIAYGIAACGMLMMLIIEFAT